MPSMLDPNPEDWVLMIDEEGKLIVVPRDDHPNLGEPPRKWPVSTDNDPEFERAKVARLSR